MFDPHATLSWKCGHDVAHLVPILRVVDHAIELGLHVFLVLQRIFAHLQFGFQFAADAVLFGLQFVLFVFEEFEFLCDDEVFLHDFFAVVH